MTSYFATYERRVVEIPGIGSSELFGNQMHLPKKKKEEKKAYLLTKVRTYCSFLNLYNFICSKQAKKNQTEIVKKYKKYM